MIVRITHIDGKLPNLALMKIAAFHRARGDEIHFSKAVERGLDEPRPYDRAYASAIFAYKESLDRVAVFREQFPEALIGGTHDASNPITVEELLGIEADAPLDYSIYPEFYASIGFTQRGCRLKCGFCVVPKKEGKNRTVSTIESIYRGKRTREWLDTEKRRIEEKNLKEHRQEVWAAELELAKKENRAPNSDRAPYVPDLAPEHRRQLHLLDNDFFGQPRDQWEARLDEIKRGGFKICLNQGINVRMIDDESAEALSKIPYYDDAFGKRRLYTAWDNIGDEERFFTGVDTLERHGIPGEHIMAYMLVGYDKRETWERVLYRFAKMIERGIKPYPMVFGNRDRKLPLGDTNLRIGHRTLRDFQRWGVRRYYMVTDFENFDTREWQEPQPDLFATGDAA